MRILVSDAALAPWADPDTTVCIRVEGDSMEPALRDGDLVAVDHAQADPTDGGIFVVRTDDGLVAKRLRRASGRWEMASDNPAYDARAFCQGDRIIGRVAWVGPSRINDTYAGLEGMG